jgi:hypothetical protein
MKYVREQSQGIIESSHLDQLKEVAERITELKKEKRSQSSASKSLGSQTSHQELPSSRTSSGKEENISIPTDSVVSRLCGVVTAVEPMFGWITTESGEVPHPRLGKFFSGRLVQNGTKVIIKITSREQAQCIETVQQQVLEVVRMTPTARSWGFLLPLFRCTLPDDEERNVLVMEKVRPLSFHYCIESRTCINLID